jgi:hypothetical protein
MAIDTPATIAVLGAGPIGLEAALYARYLGYNVNIYERGSAGENVRRWGHVRMYTRFGENRSPLALAALHTQDPHWTRPHDNELLIGAEYVDRFLVPLSQSDLLVDGLHEQTEVMAVGRDGLRKDDLAEDESRGDWMFRLLLRNANGQESIELADIVIDTTGMGGNSCWIGQGAIPAIGELALRSEIEYAFPDILGTQHSRYADRHTLVVGDILWTAATLNALVRLAEQSPSTKITWLSDRGYGSDEGKASPEPIRRIDEPASPDRALLVRQANDLATAGHPALTYLPATMVDAVERLDDRKFRVKLIGRHAGEVECNNIVANVGCRPDYRFLQELQISSDPVTETPTLARGSGLITTEPNFYVLGAKSYGRRDDFLIRNGLDQIRELFKIIGDRETLDLYATMTNLL